MMQFWCRAALVLCTQLTPLALQRGRFCLRPKEEPPALQQPKLLRLERTDNAHSVSKGEEVTNKVPAPTSTSTPTRIRGASGEGRIYRVVHEALYQLINPEISDVIGLHVTASASAVATHRQTSSVNRKLLGNPRSLEPPQEPSPPWRRG